MGIDYGKKGKHKKAIEAFKQPIRIDPDFAEAHLMLGITYFIFENTGAALEQ